MKVRSLKKNDTVDELGILFPDHPSPMVVLEKDTLAFRFFNKAARKLLQIKAADSASISLHNFFPKEISVIRKSIRTPSKSFTTLGLWNFDYSGQVKYLRVEGKNISLAKNSFYVLVLQDVTEQIVAQQSLHDFHQAVANASIISKADKKGNITYVNSNFVKISGYKNSELLKKNHRIINSGFHPKEFWINMWKTISSGKTWRAEVKNKAKDGSYYWVDTFVMPFMDERGQVKEFLSIRNDITIRKEAEMQLTENENFLRKLLGGLPAAVYTTDAEGYITLYNDAAAKLWGRKPKLMKEKWCGSFKLFTKEGVPIHHEECPMGIAIQTNTLMHGEEAMLQRPNGERINFLAYATPFRNGAGKVVGAMNVMIDIMDRIKAEKEVIKSKKKLKEIINSINGVVWEADAKNFRITFISDQVKKFGYPIEQWTAEPSFWKDHIHPNDQERVLSLLRASRQKDNHPVEYRLIQEDGSVVWIRDLITIRKSRITGVMSDITWRKKSEEELLKLAMIAAHTSNAIIIADQEGLVTWVNEGFTRISGYTLPEVIGKKPGSFLQGPDTDMHTVDVMRKAIEEGKGCKIEILNYSKAGKAYWLDIEIMPIHKQNGKLNGFMAIQVDITTLKLAAQEIMESEQRLRTIIETSPECIKILDRQGHLLDMNPAGLQMIEADNLDSVYGKQVTPLIHPAYRLAYVELLKRVFEGESGSLEFQITGLKGTQRWLETHTVPMRNTKGEVTATLGVTRDVTERKKMEHKLQETSNRLELATLAAGLGVWQTDYRTSMLTGNSRTVEMFGIKSSRINQDFYWSLIHEDDREQKKQRDLDLIGSNVTSYMDEYRMVRPTDGKVLYIKARGYIFRNEEGTALSGISVNYDQTKEKQYEETLVKSLKEKDTLIKEIHHRVKNNLQLISSMLYLKMVSISDSNTLDFLSGMRERIKSLSLVHERLLQAERLDSINIENYLMKLIDDLGVTYHRSNFKLTFEPIIEPLLVYSDIAMNCGQLVNELVINSMKHAFRDRTRGTITISLKRIDGHCHLTIADDGNGFPDTVNPLLSKSYGMQLIQIFVKQLKGEMDIVHQNGTQFNIRFACTHPEILESN